MHWRLILDSHLPGAENMARDAAILKALEEGQGQPTLRLYGWDRPTISIGYAQSSGVFEAFGMPVVRRITGGRAVLHFSEVTYSVAGLNEDPLFSGGILDTYSVISGAIVEALMKCGVEASLSKGSAGRGRSEACFHTPSRFEVLCGGRKLVGSAQRRFKRAFLQHGSILMGIDREINELVFGQEIPKRMAAVSEFSRVSEAELRRLIVTGFSKAFHAEFIEQGLTKREDEIEAALLTAAGQLPAAGKPLAG